MFSRLMAGRRRGRSAKVERRLREAVCQPLEERLLLSKTIYVDVNSPAPATNGPTWATAYKDLQLALGVAVSGDTIEVADGTYKPTSGTDRTISFQLKTGVAIYGGYAGYGATNPDARDVAAYPTILSGDIGTVGTTTDNSYHVVVGSGTTSTAVLDGFTITLGNATGTTDPTQRGGGMYNLSGSPTVRNCIFTGNSAIWGGGMENWTSSPTVTNCTFIRNVVSAGGAGGGGMDSTNSSSPTVTNCAFNGNVASDGGTGFNAGGGAVDISFSSFATLTNCTFSGNTAVNGGAMFIYQTSATVINCTFSGNTANSNGGAVYDYVADTPTLTNCIIWGSGTTPIYNNSSTQVITYTDIQGGYNGTGNINADPLFVRTPSPGPDGTWGTSDDDYGDLRLRLNSLAIDAGKNASVPAGITTDFAGAARFKDVPSKVDTGAGNAPIVDMGAYEASWSAVMYVDPTATGVEDGTAWATAYRSFASALAMAVPGQEIHVAQGSYKPTPTADRTATFQLTNFVTALGSYAGYSSASPNVRSTTLYPSVLSGDIGTVGTNTDNSYHVVTGSGTNSTAILDGFTIMLGNANATSPNNCGGGMYNLSSSPTVRNCAFDGNLATNGGGVYDNLSSSPTLVNCTFSGNSASSLGGGMCNLATSNPTVANCSFSGNAATTNGGAVYNSSSSPTVTNCIIWGSGTTPIYNSSSTLVATYSDVQGSYTGTGNINADPKFARTPSSGSDAQWGTSDDDYGDLRLCLSSPVIDAGSNAAVPANVTTDLAGSARFKDVPSKADTGAGTAPIVDMGAYEASWSAVMYVDASTTGVEDGTTWATAYRSFASALAIAGPTQEIHVAHGTYKPTPTTDRTATFQLKSFVTVLGSYAGYGAASPDVRSTILYPSVLSGDI
ncbi:MAG: right-handed parallel beta-helix repeat-containing protein, partial [Tepidisphaeraceae bacterium]